MSFLYKDFSFDAPRKSAPGTKTLAALRPPGFVAVFGNLFQKVCISVVHGRSRGRLGPPTLVRVVRDTARR